MADEIHPHYDGTATVAVTAPIVGSLGGLVVTAVVLVLTVGENATPAVKPKLLLASALLAVSFIGSVAGAFTLASLAGNVKESVVVPVAGTWMGVGPAISIVAVLDAFQVLSSAYLPGATWLFSTMALLLALGAGYFNSWQVVDEWDASPGVSDWIVGREHAKRLSGRMALIAAALSILGYLMYALGWTIHLSSASATPIGIIGMGVVIGTCMFGFQRSMLLGDSQQGFRRWETLVIPAVTGGTMGALFVFLPR